LAVKVEPYPHTPLLRGKMQQRLANFEPASLDTNDHTQAAVALTVVNDSGNASLIVTRRTPKLKSHGGQWALPGGRIDPGETPIVAAMRELEEEVALSLSNSALLGCLDSYQTRSGYVITPCVFWSEAKPGDLVPSPEEVESIHMFSFHELMRDDSPNLEQIPESDRDVLSMNYLDDVIYAPTAALLYQFREVCLRGRETRVAHFDQPVFAWR
jgi:8-oxo-dGTP pyrophosphatase MutT (NUDIX family)